MAEMATTSQMISTLLLYRVTAMPLARKTVSSSTITLPLCW